VPPHLTCVKKGHASSEVTRAICRVPSTQFSQAPWYTLPDHLCRFRVRSIMAELFPGTAKQPGQSNKSGQHSQSVTTARPTNINVVPIDYAFLPRLRGRLTLLRLTLSRNPWSFGERVSHPLYRYSCQHSRFRYLQKPSRVFLHQPTERSATTCASTHPQLRCTA
jgi:hypothetical protein